MTADDWWQEQVRDRLQRLHAKRPPVFAADGTLHPDIATWADKHAAGNPGGLILVGNIGVGKTWSLWKIAETLISRGYRGGIEIVTAHELKRIIAPPTDQATLDRLAAASILALDDIGAIRVSDWDADNLAALVDDRWRYQRPTILTSNNPALRDLLGERVASRLADNAAIVRMTGPDRRRNP